MNSVDDHESTPVSTSATAPPPQSESKPLVPYWLKFSGALVALITGLVATSQCVSLQLNSLREHDLATRELELKTGEVRLATAQAEAESARFREQQETTRRQIAQAEASARLQLAQEATRQAQLSLETVETQAAFENEKATREQALRERVEVFDSIRQLVDDSGSAGLVALVSYLGSQGEYTEPAARAIVGRIGKSAEAEEVRLLFAIIPESDPILVPHIVSLQLMAMERASDESRLYESLPYPDEILYPEDSDVEIFDPTMGAFEEDSFERDDSDTVAPPPSFVLERAKAVHDERKRLHALLRRDVAIVLESRRYIESTLCRELGSLIQRATVDSSTCGNLVDLVPGVAAVDLDCAADQFTVRFHGGASDAYLLASEGNILIGERIDSSFTCQALVDDGEDRSLREIVLTRAADDAYRVPYEFQYAMQDARFAPEFTLMPFQDSGVNTGGS